MKNPNKRELQQNTQNHSSDLDFKDFVNIYQKRSAESYSFLVYDADLPSDNPLRFRKNLLKQIYKKSSQLMIRLRMKNCNLILIEKLRKYLPYHHAKLISMNV